MKKSLLIAGVLLSTLTFSQTWNTTGNAGTTPANNFLGTTIIMNKLKSTKIYKETFYWQFYKK